MDPTQKTRDLMALGEFGIFTHSAFEHYRINNSISVTEALSRIMPLMRVDEKTGAVLLQNAVRGGRPSKRGKDNCLPRGIDVYAGIVNGSTDDDPQQGRFPGHTILMGADRTLDNITAESPYCDRAVCNAYADSGARAVCTINKYPSFIRCIDDALLAKFTEFLGKQYGSAAELPIGVNLNSFPIKFYDSLSTMSVYDLRAVLKATRQGVQQVMNGYKELPTHEPVGSFQVDVFFNIGPLAGGTVSRIHSQAYIRALPEKAPQHCTYLRPQHDHRLTEGNNQISLLQNRHWNVFLTPFPSSGYEMKIEQRNTGDILTYTDEELWDLAELLIISSKKLDMVGAREERNILFYPSGVVVRPMQFVGCMEQMYNMLITTQTTPDFMVNFQNASVTDEERRWMYAIPVSPPRQMDNAAPVGLKS